MDLKNFNITVDELLENQKAKAILSREFPTLINSPMVKLYKNLSLKKVLSYAKGNVPEEKLQRIIKELENI